MTNWTISATWDLDAKPKEFVPRTNLLAKPMSWEKWRGEALERDLPIQELFHTDSGYYGAFDKATKRRVGAWVDRDGGLGYFEDQPQC